jgi:glycosyltransferase involved in cell wall biosynthesis
MYPSAEAAWKQLARRFDGIRPGFMLYVSGIEFRKNHEGLITGYGRLPPCVRAEHQLVVACRMLPEQMAMIREHANRVGVGADDLVLTGYVTDAELGALYHACKLFVFPSLYEGSGLPMLEAMSCGAPVAASSTSTSPEILGDRDATFDPRDPDSIAACLAQAISSPSELERLRERSRRRVAEYTWTQVAEHSIDAYERALDRGPRRRFRRPRIAFVTPWLPEESGISTYNLRLASELRKRVDLDIVVAQAAEAYSAPHEPGLRLLAARDFKRLHSLRQHDRIVYCMGGSKFHGHVYELLQREPGALVLHDAQFTGFYGWYAGQERPEDPVGRLGERIHAMYSDRLPPDVTRNGAPDWDRQLALGIYMTRELQSHAEECFVHSRFARGILELDREPLARSVPISLLPFGLPPPMAAPRGAVSLSPLIISLGVVHEIKGLATLISAFGLLAADLPDARLVIAGTAALDQSQRWHNYVRQHAPDANIELPGHVSAERYAELLRTADLAVQLRLASNGEASAAVADCLSYGLPTIVTDLGWAGELPDAAVAKQPLGIEPAQLKDRMLWLLTEPAERRLLSEAALEYARECSFARVADAYVDALGLD